MFIDRYITNEKASVMYAMQIVRHWAVFVLLQLNSVTTFLKNRYGWHWFW